MQLQPVYSEGEAWLRLASEYGLSFEVLELSTPPAIADGELSGRMERWYKASGLVTSVHGAFIDNNPASGDPEIAALCQRRCRESCALAKRLGAGQVVFHSGAFPFLRGSYLENWAEKCGAFYRSLAEEYDLNIFVENSMDVDAEPLRTLMDGTASSKVGVCLDVGHAHYSRQSIREWFRALEGHIGYVHLSDNRGSFDDHLPLGSGDVDWREVNELMTDFHGFITLETGNPENTRRSIEFLARNGLENLRR